MKKFTILLALLSTFFICAQDEATTGEVISEVDFHKVMDSINNQFTYQYGKVILDGDMASIQVPKGYKFLDAEQSKEVLTNLWGNPPN